MKDKEFDYESIWQRRDNNPSWHRKPFAIYLRNGKYELYHSIDGLLGKYDSFPEASDGATDYMIEIHKRLVKRREKREHG